MLAGEDVTRHEAFDCFVGVEESIGAKQEGKSRRDCRDGNYREWNKARPERGRRGVSVRPSRRRHRGIMAREWISIG
jgi:hypothetical protein